MEFILWMVIVGLQFEAQAQIIWGLGPMSPIQWICREWVKELSPNEFVVYHQVSYMEAWWYTTPLASQLIRQQVGGVFFDVGLLGPSEKACRGGRWRCQACLGRCKACPGRCKTCPGRCKTCRGGRGRCQACLGVAKQAYTS